MGLRHPRSVEGLKPTKFVLKLSGLRIPALTHRRKKIWEPSFLLGGDGLERLGPHIRGVP